MTEEYNHPELDFTGFEPGENWYNEHQDLSQHLLTLTKHISRDGLVFSPERVQVGNAPSEDIDVARLADLPDTSNFSQVGHDHSGESINPTDARIGETIGYEGYPNEGAYTIHVRNSGSDTNSGLTASDPVATIGEAITRIPRLPIENANAESVVIVLGGGETYAASDIQIRTPWMGKVWFRTADGTKATLQVPSGSDGFLVFRSSVGIDDVRIEAADTSNPHNSAVMAREQSTVDIRSNTDIIGGLGSTLARAEQASYIIHRSGSTIDGNGDGAHGMAGHSGGFVTTNGTVQNCDRGLWADRNGSASNINGTIDNCTTGLHTEDNGAAKSSGGAITNCTTGLFSRTGGITTAEQSPDFTGTTTVANQETLGRIVRSDGTTMGP